MKVFEATKREKNRSRVVVYLVEQTTNYLLFSNYKPTNKINTTGENKRKSQNHTQIHTYL